MSDVSEDNAVTTDNGAASQPDQNDMTSKRRPKKRIKLGYKEDPFVFFGENEEVWTSVRYSLNLLFYTASVQSCTNFVNSKTRCKF